MMKFCFLRNCSGIFLNEHPGYRHWNHSMDDGCPNSPLLRPNHNADDVCAPDANERDANDHGIHTDGTNAKAPYKDDANTNHYNAKPNSMRNAKNNANPTIMNC